MTEKMPVFLRAHTKVAKSTTNKPTETPTPRPNSTVARERPSAPKWPEYALVLDCETTTDTRQAFTFGMSRFCHAIGNQFSCIEEGIVYPDDLAETDPNALEILRRYAAEVEAETLEDYSRQIRVRSRSEFAEDMVARRGECPSGGCGF